MTFSPWLLLLLVALVVVVPPVVRRARERRRRAEVFNLAQALGLQVLEDMEAALRTVPAARREEARERQEQLPAWVRKMVSRPAKGALCLAGAIDGAEISVFIEQRGSGKSNHTHTVVRADYPRPLPFEFAVSHQGALARLGAAFGREDLEVGDPEFDAAVCVRTAEPGPTAEALRRPGVRDAVLGLFALSKESSVTNAFAQWEVQGTALDLSRTRERIAAVSAVARTLAP